VIVRRLMRQHGCVLLAIPKSLLGMASLSAGDYVAVSLGVRNRSIIVRKVVLEGKSRGRSA